MTCRLASSPCLSALLCAFVWSAEARAYEDQVSLDLASGVAVAAASEALHPVGPQLSVGVTQGISPQFLARGQLGYAPLFDGETVQHVGQVRLEAAYVIDVLQVVPLFGAGGSLWLYDDGADVRLRPGVHVLVGFDYLVSRAWALGLDLRSGLLVEPAQIASVTDVQLRVSRLFELF